MRSIYSPEDCAHITGHSFPKRAYLAWVTILHFFPATIVLEVEICFEEVRIPITPNKCSVYICRNSHPGCQRAWISNINLVEPLVVGPVFVAFEEEGEAVQVSGENGIHDEEIW